MFFIFYLFLFWGVSMVFCVCLLVVFHIYNVFLFMGLLVVFLVVWFSREAVGSVSFVHS